MLYSEGYQTSTSTPPSVNSKKDSSLSPSQSISGCNFSSNCMYSFPVMARRCGMNNEPYILSPTNNFSFVSGALFPTK